MSNARTIGIYRILERVGQQGGFGSVYKCIDNNDDSVCYAMKILERLDEMSILRFQKEVRITKRLSHPNVIEILDADLNREQPYYVMQLCNYSLASIMSEIYTKPKIAYDIMNQIFSGVEYLHTEGVYHRDLKPENILIKDGKVFISDLGLGVQITSDSERLTRLGEGFGTLRYVAPEQWQDASSVDQRADIYSLGKIIEDIVTYENQSSILDVDFQYIIDRCVDPNPDKRFSTISDVVNATESVFRKVFGTARQNPLTLIKEQIEKNISTPKFIEELAMYLSSCSNIDDIDEIMMQIKPMQFKAFTAQHPNISESIIEKFTEHLMSQNWGFNYTDKIGNQCEALYSNTTNIHCKANLLTTIVKVGVNHNRWHVMGIARSLLNSDDISKSIPLQLELVECFVNERIGRYYMNSLEIEINMLPDVLHRHFNTPVREQVVPDDVELPF